MEFKERKRVLYDKLDDFLLSRGIKNKELFFNPGEYENTLSEITFNQMYEAALLFMAHLKLGNKIGVLVDSDADGFTSASMMVRYINESGENKAEFFLHEEKRHGLDNENILDKIFESDIDLLIIPDAASNNKRELQLLHHGNIDAIVLDHHEIEEESYIEPIEGLHVVNTKSKHNPDSNKELTGAGMVYQFLKLLDAELKENRADFYTDLMAIGQIADSSDIVDPYIRKKVFEGLSNVNNELVKHILKEEEVDIDDVIPRDVSFKISPFLNAVCRVGDMDERTILFSVLSGIDLDNSEFIEKRKKNKETGKFEKIMIEQTKIEQCYDMLKKVKSRQQRVVKAELLKLQQQHDENSLVGIFELDDSKNKAITGLIAMKLSEQFEKPCLVIHGDDVLHGSGRGYETAIDGLKTSLENTELFNFVSGHENAFGLEITEEKLELFKSQNKKETTKETVYEVDELQVNHFDDSSLEFYIDNIHLIGGSFTESILGFQDINIKKRFINVRGSMVTFLVYGTEFVMYNVAADKLEQLSLGFNDSFNFNFVGSPGIASFGKNKGNAQIVLKDFEFEAVYPETVQPSKITVENISF